MKNNKKDLLITCKLCDNKFLDSTRVNIILIEDPKNKEHEIKVIYGSQEKPYDICETCGMKIAEFIIMGMRVCIGELSAIEVGDIQTMTMESNININ